MNNQIVLGTLLMLSLMSVGINTAYAHHEGSNANGPIDITPNHHEGSNANGPIDITPNHLGSYDKVMSN